MRSLTKHSLPLSLFLLVASIRGGPASSLPNVLHVAWETQLRSESPAELEYAAVSPKDRAVWIVTSSRPKGAFSGPKSLSLWRVSSDGNAAPPIDLEYVAVAAANQAERPVFEDVAVLKGGDVAVAAELVATGEASVVVINAATERAGPANKIGSQGPLE